MSAMEKKTADRKLQIEAEEDEELTLRTPSTAFESMSESVLEPSVEAAEEEGEDILPEPIAFCEITNLLPRSESLANQISNFKTFDFKEMRQCLKSELMKRISQADSTEDKMRVANDLIQEFYDLLSSNLAQI